MAKRPCAEPGCPALLDKAGRCGPHQRERDRQRGSRQVRGYDAEHDAARRGWAPKVATGTVVCRRAPSGQCLRDDPLIAPDEPWQLGHPDAQCPAPRAPEHRLCNVSTAPRRWGGGTPSAPR